ncbi:MAG: adaptor protein MecA [Defluviitaleaceae bacterium]|nr:adaptor protein MecA [Defluviitaleaceae bacterium]
MKIEKISENQVRFVLRTQDLEERDMKINEISYASDKTQQLFREIMEIVQDGGEFFAENTPLMFEAMRMGVDSLVVVVTKISGQQQGTEGNISLIPKAKHEAMFKKGDIISQPEQPMEDGFSVFSFDNMEEMAAAVAGFDDRYDFPSQAHKLDGRYFLVIQNETLTLAAVREIDGMLCEYGQKHMANAISQQYLLERGEVFIATQAVEKLRKYKLLAAQPL